MKLSNPTKRGQFWRNPLGVIVFVTNTRRDKIRNHRNVYYTYATAPDLFSSRTEEDFIADYALVEDREVILHTLLPTLLGLVHPDKREKFINYKELGLTEEERGLVLLNMLNKGEE